MPVPPDSLRGVPLLMKVDFVSPMANALRQTGAETTRALLQDVMGLAQANPDILDKVDMDQVVDELAAGLGVPGKVVRADADVAALRQARAEAQAQTQEMMLEQQQAQSAAGTAKTLADTAKTLNDMRETEA